MAIVKVLEPRKNVSTKTGKRDSRAATLAVTYYTWGRGTQRETARGEWYGPDGPQAYEDIRGWARTQAREHDYTFKIVLSAEAGADLDALAWQRIMQSQSIFSDWRLITNADTDNRHAHVVVFGDRVYGTKGDKILEGRAFKPWFAGLRAQIKQEEQQYRADLRRRREEERERSLREIGL